MNRSSLEEAASKVPAVTLGFWLIKVRATTLGETGGDTVSTTLNLGYLVSTGIFTAILVVLVAGQILARRFHPFIYWATIIASTTAGTTMADYTTRSLGIGYPGGSIFLVVCVMVSLLVWRLVVGKVAAVQRPRGVGGSPPPACGTRLVRLRESDTINQRFIEIMRTREKFSRLPGELGATVVS